MNQNFEYLEDRCQSKDGMRLFIRSWHPSEGIQGGVCFLHGLGEHSGRYEHVALHLIQNGYSFFIFDLRGHGLSDGKRGHTDSYNTLMSDIDLMLNEFSSHLGGYPIFLCGHSLGGNLAANYVLRCQPKLDGLILSSPWLKLTFQPPPLKLAIAKAMNRVWPGFSHVNALEIKALSHVQRIIDEYIDDPLVHDRISAKMFFSIQQAGQWAIEHASEISIPVLIMHGSGDRITSHTASIEFAEKMKTECTLKLWDGLYHELHNEYKSQEVLTFLTDWLTGHIHSLHH